MKKEINQQIKELTLFLLWLTHWKEKESGVNLHRSWKGYDFDILNVLNEEGLISGAYKSKSVIITQEGIKEAKKLKKKYLK